MALPPLPERETLRLHQANERTFLAWMRTALALIGAGFIVARFGMFMRELAAAHGTEIPASAGWSQWLGVGLTSLGAVTIVGSLFRYRSVATAIERHEVGSPGSIWIYVVSVLVVLLGAGVVVLLLVSGP
jgi:putative membrane protein